LARSPARASRSWPTSSRSGSAASAPTGSLAVSSAHRSIASSTSSVKAAGPSGTEPMADKRTLTFVLMDPPFENARTTTALRLMDLAVKRGWNVNVFAYEGAVYLAFAKQTPHENRVHGHDLEAEDHPNTKEWVADILAQAQRTGREADRREGGLGAVRSLRGRARRRGVHSRTAAGEPGGPGRLHRSLGQRASDRDEVELRMPKKILQVVESAFRATIEEQDDTVIWLTHAMRGAGGEFGVLLRGNAVNTAVRGQDPSGLAFGDRVQRHRTDLADDIAKLIGKGVRVSVVRE